MRRRRIAIVGGGAAGVALAWCLTSLPRLRRDWSVTLLHDEEELGGNARTVPVWFDDAGRGHASPAPAEASVYPVDLGGLFVCPSLHPNLYRQLELPEFRDRVRLERHPALRLAGALGSDTGGDMVWGNFREYQRGDRFRRCLDRATRRYARRFQRDVYGAWWQRRGGRRVWTLTAAEYLPLAGIPRDSSFVRNLLIPYLCILNGNAGPDVLETSIRDLFPVFARLPFVQDAGPGASFLQPGYGWDRFAGGAASWVDAMAGGAAASGVQLRTGSMVKRVTSTRSGVVVEWDAPAFSDPGWAEFDTVVLTTDMTTNRELLNHPGNAHWTEQAPQLSAERYRLAAGSCYVHQDGSLLAPQLSDAKEDAQFTAAPVIDPSTSELPYDLGASYQTYLMGNILGTPHPCYVSVYGESDRARRPDPATVIAQRTWRRSQSLPSLAERPGRELHRVQGVGNIYFAGSNTTFDSQEGALLSAMIVANRVAEYPYPLARPSHANSVYRRFDRAMFPR